MGKAGGNQTGPAATETTGERDLLERLRRGDAAAAAEFYAGTARRIHRYLAQALGVRFAPEADDLLHETFIALAERLPYFRGESSLFTFACAIAHRKVASFLRTRSRRERREAAEEDAAAVPAAEGDADVRRALERLSPEDREMLFLKYVEAMSVTEIAGVVGASEHAVESRLARARRRFRRSLEGLR
ncbi:MAG: polymerase sigma-70 factor, subfamily [Candidatus Binatota bacterium]|jgi:RNA polymerase sigma-70 factor (ECF subfamily)|nr:polymerase sigma-70 factor, subfamily [Candidatus Binatota bacterium]